MNTLKVGLLLTALTALFVLVGAWIGGVGGAGIAFALAIVMNVASYWYSDKLVLGMVRAQPLGPSEAPRLHEMVARLSQRAGIPMPKLYIVPDPSPNAFATGRSPQHAAVAVNQGLMDLLDEQELEGVIAHELSHVRHRDTLTMTVVATLAGAIMLLATMARFAAFFGGRDDEGGGSIFGLLIAALVAPIAASLIQLAISRAREYEADAGGARLAGSSKGLASALMKLERGAATTPSMASPSMAPLYIVAPMQVLRGLGRLFMTHPPVEERVRRLMALTP